MVYDIFQPHVSTRPSIERRPPHSQGFEVSGLQHPLMARAHPQAGKNSTLKHSQITAMSTGVQKGLCSGRPIRRTMRVWVRRHGSS
jgi:hypothetical protein